MRLEQAKAREAEAKAALTKSENPKAGEITQAQLEFNLSQQNLARIEAQRSRELVARNAGLREDLDRAKASVSRWGKHGPPGNRLERVRR
ncbi:hypothetical protein SAMN05444166_8091 [Singulisphaera sp. GP187]|uniref:hypothetical protein n=1 Tax=Singulisphaera sp. GP187 TaxID=1882752 RepID=UPI00092A30D9|nr:hypothetical protein [Singulisphaera sp. GP187]SIO66464.1 hypothetical protein SAMN05444166_8091 [Singulisphaera sp. GP187]